MNNVYEKIKKDILTDDKTASLVEYMLSKAISTSVSPTVKFIYKKHKIIKNRKKLYSIYSIENGKKLFSNIKYQDMAKYIIDNIDNYPRIRNIIKAEENVSRLQDKINFLKRQYVEFKNKDVIETKLDTSYMTYRKYKRELLSIIGKNNIC